MDKKLIEKVIENIGDEEIMFVNSNMKMDNLSLKEESPLVYKMIEDIVSDFIEDNDIEQDWFDNNFVDIEDLFDKAVIELLN